jgi:hypothetical protein
MAQASSFKSSIRYQVCNASNDNDISRLSSTRVVQKDSSNGNDDDLREITIATPNNPKRSSPNHHVSTLIRSPVTVDSAIVKIPAQHLSSSSPKHPLISSASVHSLSKGGNPPAVVSQPSRRPSVTSTVRGNALPSSPVPRSGSRQSIIDTLATTLTAVRKGSTSALALAQRRLSTDNTNLFATYQGESSVA